MKKLSLILMLLSFWNVSSSQTLRVFNYTSCPLDVKAYADTVCGWNCPSAVVTIYPGNYYDLSMINCTWTSSYKWAYIKYWKTGYYPPMTGGASQRLSGLWTSKYFMELWWRRWEYLWCLERLSLGSLFI